MTSLTCCFPDYADDHSALVVSDDWQDVLNALAGVRS